jgi:hypothetical protein
MWLLLVGRGGVCRGRPEVIVRVGPSLNGAGTNKRAGARAERAELEILTLAALREIPAQAPTHAYIPRLALERSVQSLHARKKRARVLSIDIPEGGPRRRTKAAAESQLPLSERVVEFGGFDSFVITNQQSDWCGVRTRCQMWRSTGASRT